MKALMGFSENPLTTREWKVATKPGTRTRLHDDVGEGLPRAPEDVLEVPHQDPPVEVPLQGAEGHVRGHPTPPLTLRSIRQSLPGALTAHVVGAFPRSLLPRRSGGLVVAFRTTGVFSDTWLRLGS